MKPEIAKIHRILWLQFIFLKKMFKTHFFTHFQAHLNIYFLNPLNIENQKKDQLNFNSKLSQENPSMQEIEPSFMYIQYCI